MKHKQKQQAINLLEQKLERLEAKQEQAYFEVTVNHSKVKMYEALSENPEHVDTTEIMQEGMELAKEYSRITKEIEEVVKTIKNLRGGK